MKTRNYNLRPDGEYIQLTLKNGTGMDYFTPNRNFLGILLNETISVSLFNNSGRLMAEHWSGPWSTNTRSRIYLHDLAYASYRGMVHAETLDSDLQKYFDWKNTRGLTIDHLDGNPHNNTVLNLSTMPLSANVSKKSFPAGFVSPYTLNVALVDGEYRIQVILENTRLDVLKQLLDSATHGMIHLNDGAGVSTLNFVCTDAESMVACLKHLYDLSFEWCNPGESVRAYKKTHKDTPHKAADIKQSLSAQRTLAHMDRTQFQIFSPGEHLNN